MARTPSEFRRYAATIAVFATVLYAALVIAAFGVLALLANIDVLPAGAPEFTSSFATSGTIAVVLGGTLSIAVGIPESNQRIFVGRALLDGIGAYAAFTLIAGLVELVATRDAVRALLVLSKVALEPFAIVAGIAAIVVVMLFGLVIASGVGDSERPQWPWEKDED